MQDEPASAVYKQLHKLAGSLADMPLDFIFLDFV